MGDADIRIAVINSAKRLELDLDSPLVQRAVETGVMAQEEGFNFDTAFDMAREVLVRATLSAA